MPEASIVKPSTIANSEAMPVVVKTSSSPGGVQRGGTNNNESKGDLHGASNRDGSTANDPYGEDFSFIGDEDDSHLLEEEECDISIL